MSGEELHRKPGSRRRAALAAASLLLTGFSTAARAGDDAPSAGLLDSVLQAFDLKAKPPEPAPDFVRRTRPDATGLGYMQPAVPHKVSPLPVKTADQVKAKQAALDAAKERQLNPGAPAPLDLGKGRKPAGAKPAPAAAGAAPAVAD